VEPFFSDVKLKLKLFGCSVIGSAGGIEHSVVDEECSLAIRVSWHVDDVKTKKMWRKARALRHACKYFARGGIFAFNFNVELLSVRKEPMTVMRSLGTARSINLQIRPSCQTLSNAFSTSRRIAAVFFLRLRYSDMSSMTLRS
jgi:hypothetical protein